MSLRHRLLQAPALLAGMSLVFAAAAREPVVAIDRLQRAEFVGVVLMPDGEGAAVGLRIIDGDRVVPIFIGPVEAAAIARAERGVRPVRPLTHELLGDVMTAAGAAIRRVVIDDVRDGVYYATMEIRANGRGAGIWVDARPSDSLALALRYDVPILLAPSVIDSAPEWPEDAEEAGETLQTTITL